MIEEHFFLLSGHERYTYSTFLAFAYLGTQGIGLLFRKPGKQSGFYMDLIFSVLPLFIIYESFRRGTSTLEQYDFFRATYFCAVSIDLIIFTAIAYRFAMMMNEYVSHN